MAGRRYDAGAEQPPSNPKHVEGAMKTAERALEGVEDPMPGLDEDRRRKERAALVDGATEGTFCPDALGRIVLNEQTDRHTRARPDRRPPSS